MHFIATLYLTALTIIYLVLAVKQYDREPNPITWVVLLIHLFGVLAVIAI